MDTKKVDTKKVDTKKVDTKKVVFPSDLQGLQSEVYQHFGRTPAFTIIEYQDGSPENFNIQSVEIIQNAPHEHGECMTPVMLLKNMGVSQVVVGGIGRKAILALQSRDVALFHCLPPNVSIKENFQALMEGRLPRVSMDELSPERGQ